MNIDIYKKRKVLQNFKNLFNTKKKKVEIAHFILYFFISWHICFRGLFNTKAIITEKQ